MQPLDTALVEDPRFDFFSVSASLDFAVFLVSQYGGYTTTLLSPTPPGEQCNNAACREHSLCPVGFYKQYAGDLTPCTPCGVGYFQNQTGSSTCLRCPEGKLCPLASASPIDKEDIKDVDSTKYVFPMNNATSVQKLMLLSLVAPFAGSARRAYFYAMLAVSLALLVLASTFAWLRSRKRASKYVFN
jgi:hypothetical protein